MPHCIIEYSKPVADMADINSLCETVHQTLIGTGHFTANAIKTRAQSYDVYQVGEYGQGEDFVHVTLYLLNGREVAIRQEIGQTLFKKLGALLPDVFSISVDVQEMERDTYCK